MAIAGLGVKDHDPTKLELPNSPSRAELYQQQVLSERARVQGRRSSLFLSVEGACSESQAPPLLTQSHSMDDLGELPPPAPVLSPSPTPHTFLHPLTGKPLGGSSLPALWAPPPLVQSTEHATHRVYTASSAVSLSLQIPRPHLLLPWRLGKEH